MKFPYSLCLIITGSFLLLNGLFSAAEIPTLGPGQSLQADLSPSQTQLSVLFQTGPEEIMHFQSRWREGMNPVDFILWRTNPDGSEKAIAGGVISSTSRLSLYRNIDPTRKHRISLSSKNPAGTSRLTLAASSLDNRGRAFFIRSSTEMAFFSSSGQNELGKIPLNSTDSRQWSPDGDYFLAGSDNWSLWKMFPSLAKIAEGTATSPTFSFVPDSNVLMIRQPDIQKISLVQYPQMQLLGEYEGTATALMPKADRLIISGAAKGLIIHPETGEILLEWPSRDQAMAHRSPDGNYVAFQDIGQATSYRVQLFSTVNGAFMGSPVELEEIQAVEFSPDSQKMLISGILSNDAQKLYRTFGYLTRNFEPFIDTNDIRLRFPVRLLFGPQSRLLSMIPVNNEPNSYFQIYDLDNRVRLNRFFNFNRISKIFFHPEGKSLLVQGIVNRDGLDNIEIKLIDGIDGFQLWQSNPLQISNLEYNFSGDQFCILGLFADANNTPQEEVQLRNSISGELIRPPEYEDDWQNSDWKNAHFNTEGNLLITQVFSNFGPLYGTSDTFLLWDSATGERINPPPYTNWVFFGLQNTFYDPDSSHFLVFRGSESFPPSIRFLNLQNGELVNEVEGFQWFGPAVQNYDNLHIAFQFIKNGESLPRIGLASFETASINESQLLENMDITKMSWSNDGRLILIQGEDPEQPRKMQLLLDASTLEILANWSENATDLDFDLTQPPFYLNQDLNEDGSLDSKDFFLLQQEWDPLYPEVGYQFMKNFRNR